MKIKILSIMENGTGEKAIEKYYGEGNTLVKEVVSE